MSVAVVFGICAAGLIAIAAVAAGHGRPPTGSLLRWAALVLTVGIVARVLPVSLDGDGWFPYALVGIPLVAAVAPLLAQAVGRLEATVTALAAVVMFGWGLLLALGVGGYFVFPALVLGLAAAFSIRSRPAASAPGPGGSAQAPLRP